MSDVYQWTGSNNADLGSAINWYDTTNPGMVMEPGSTDVAIIEVGQGLYGTLNVAALDLVQASGAPTLSITGSSTSVTAGSVGIGNGFTLDTGASLYAGNLCVDGSGTVVTVQNEATLSDTGAAENDQLEIGSSSGTTTVLVTAGGTFEYTSTDASGIMSIGYASGNAATLEINDGGYFASTLNELDIGAAPGSNASGNLTVTGAGSQFLVNNYGYTTIGDFGERDSSSTGTVTVTDGGYVSLSSDGEVDVGTSGGMSTITVSGANSAIEAGPEVLVGINGYNIAGQILVEDGGEFDTATDLYLGDGLLSVTGVNSLYTGRYLVSEGGTTVDVGTGALIHVGDVELSGTMNLTGGSVNVRANFIAYAGGKVSGYGTISGANAYNYGVIDAQGGALTISGPVSSPSGSNGSTGTLEISSGATLQLNGTVSSGQTVDFLAGSGGLVLGNPGGFAATISGFAPGDTIDLLNTKVTGASVTGTTLTVALSGGGTDSFSLLGYTGDGLQLGTSGTDALITDLSNTATLTTGTDIVDFTTGTNTVTATAATLQAGDTITGGIGTDTLALSGNFSSPFTFGTTTLTGFEGITVAAGNNYDLILNAATDPSGKSFKVDGNVLDSTKALTLDGHLVAGNLTVLGGAGADTLTGGAGNDVINGGAGVDTMTGGAGNDTYYVDNAGDKVIEANNGGNDLVYSSVSFSLAGQFVETLTLTGTANINATGNGQANTLNGNSGNNVLDGGAGADTMAGGAGNDTYYVDNVGDHVIEASGGGNDTVYSSVSFSLAGQFIETLDLTGTSAINATGNGQANTLVGNSGANILTGGGGGDTLTGGAGADTFLYSALSDSTSSAPDLITDFQHGTDKIDLSALHLHSTDTFTITSSGGITTLSVFESGHTTADTLIKLTGTNVVTASDILWGTAPGAPVARLPVVAAPPTPANDHASLADHHDLVSALHAVTVDHGVFG